MTDVVLIILALLAIHAAWDEWFSKDLNLTNMENLTKNEKRPVYVMVSTECPICGENLNRAISAGEELGKPEEGDYNICAHCSCVMRFTADGTPRVIKDSELEELKTEAPDVWKTLESLIKAINKA